MLRVRSRRISRKSRHIKPQAASSNAEKIQILDNERVEVNKSRLDLLEKICRHVRSIKRELPVISIITEMARYALNASASSMIIPDEQDKKILYQFTDGPLGKQFKELQTNEQAGITGWVLQSGKPLIIKDFNKDERFNKFKDEVDGLVTRSVICAPLIVKGIVFGVIEVFNKLDGNDFNDHDLITLERLATNDSLMIENIRANESLLNSYKVKVQKLVSLLDVRETTASEHARRVSEYALIGANELSLSDEEKQAIKYGAILHDIGQLTIPQSILNKRDTLTQEDWEIIRKHPVIGYNLLRGIPSLNQVSKLVLYHHERYDGKGYPCGLKGKIIPIGARLIAVADAFDSMTVKHSYRAAFSTEDALAELGRCAGSQFCPVAAKAFCLGFIKSHSSGRYNLEIRGLT
jgi:hypothetical protein